MTSKVEAFKRYVETAAPMPKKPMPGISGTAKTVVPKKPDAIQKAMKVPAISSSPEFKAALTRAGFKRDFDVGMIAVTFSTKGKKTPKQVNSTATRLQKIAVKMDPNARVDDVGITFNGVYYPHLVMTSGLADRDAAVKKLFARLQKECLAKAK